MTPNRKKCPHVVHFKVPRDWLETNSRHQKRYSKDARRQDRVKIGEDEVEEVEEFVYLGATVRKDGGGTEDIRNRLNKARRAFYNLTKIWR